MPKGNADGNSKKRKLDATANASQTRIGKGKQVAERHFLGTVSCKRTQLVANTSPQDHPVGPEYGYLGTSEASVKKLEGRFKQDKCVKKESYPIVAILPPNTPRQEEARIRTLIQNFVANDQKLHADLDFDGQATVIDGHASLEAERRVFKLQPEQQVSTVNLYSCELFERDNFDGYFVLTTNEHQDDPKRALDDASLVMTYINTCIRAKDDRGKERGGLFQGVAPRKFGNLERTCAHPRFRDALYAIMEYTPFRRFFKLYIASATMARKSSAFLLAMIFEKEVRHWNALKQDTGFIPTDTLFDALDEINYALKSCHRVTSNTTRYDEHGQFVHSLRIPTPEVVAERGKQEAKALRNAVAASENEVHKLEVERYAQALEDASGKRNGQWINSASHDDWFPWTIEPSYFKAESTLSDFVTASSDWILTATMRHLYELTIGNNQYVKVENQVGFEEALIHAGLNKDNLDERVLSPVGLYLWYFHPKVMLDVFVMSSFRKPRTISIIEVERHATTRDGRVLHHNWTHVSLLFQLLNLPALLPLPASPQEAKDLWVAHRDTGMPDDCKVNQRTLLVTVDDGKKKGAASNENDADLGNQRHGLGSKGDDRGGDDGGEEDEEGGEGPETGRKRAKTGAAGGIRDEGAAQDRETGALGGSKIDTLREEEGRLDEEIADLVKKLEQKQQRKFVIQKQIKRLDSQDPEDEDEEDEDEEEEE